MNNDYDKKSKWKELAQFALNQLAKASPSSSPTARRDFVTEIENNRTRFNYLRKQKEKGGTSAADTLKDWFKKWIADAEAAKNKRGPAEERQHDGEEWQVKSGTRRGNRATSSPTTPAGTSPTTSSSTSASSLSYLRSGRSGKDGQGVRGGKKDVDADTWKNLQLADECPMIDTQTGEEAPVLDPSASVDTATGYYFCTTREASNIHAKFAHASRPITLIMPPYGKTTRESIEIALKQLTDESRQQHDIPIDPGIRETTLFVKEPTSGAKKTVCALLVHIDKALPILPPQ
jgi:hypothetical protein